MHKYQGDIFSIPTTPTVSLTVLGTRRTLNIIIITWKNNSAVGLLFSLDALIVTQLAWHLFSWFSGFKGQSEARGNESVSMGEPVGTSVAQEELFISQQK